MEIISTVSHCATHYFLAFDQNELLFICVLITTSSNGTPLSEKKIVHLKIDPHVHNFFCFLNYVFADFSSYFTQCFLVYEKWKFYAKLMIERASIMSLFCFRILIQRLKVKTTSHFEMEFINTIIIRLFIHFMKHITF